MRQLAQRSGYAVVVAEIKESNIDAAVRACTAPATNGSGSW